MTALTPTYNCASALLLEAGPRAWQSPGVWLNKTFGWKLDSGMGAKIVRKLIELEAWIREEGKRAIEPKIEASHCHEDGLPCTFLHDLENLETGLKHNSPVSKKSPCESKPRAGLDYCVYSSPSEKEYLCSSSKKGMAQKIRGQTSSFCRDNRISPAETRGEKFFVKIYGDYRRQVQSLYRPSRSHVAHLAKAASRLREQGVPSKFWKDYIEWLGREFIDVVRGSGKTPPAVLPAHVVGSMKFIEYFWDNILDAQLDVESAIKMLGEAGFGDLDGWSVLAAAVEGFNKGRPPRGLLPRYPRYHEAVTWLIPRMDDVGYVVRLRI